MKEDEDGERGECVERPRGGDQRGPVAAEDEGVVGDADDGEDEQDHDGAQPSQRGTEPEHVPRHRRPRSVHLRRPATPRRRGARWSGAIRGEMEEMDFGHR